MTKVFIGVGHGGKDAGAVGYLVEKDVNLKMAKACRDYLVKNGVEVKMSRVRDENDDISEEIRECNAFSPDLAIDVHNNAGGGDGFEILHSIAGGTSKKLAQNIEAEGKKIGQSSRGLKTKKNRSGSDYFGFLRCIKCPSVICEGVFVDNKADASAADTDAECKTFGEAYAKGILKTLGVKCSGGTINISSNKNKAHKTDSGTSGSSFKVKVTADKLNIRSGAGIAFRVEGVIDDKGTYTIVQEKNGWGKLKSGAGWINLKYTKRV